MKFRKLPKEKRTQLILVILVTLAALAGLGFGVVKYQYANLTRFAAKKTDAHEKLQQMQDHIKHAGALEAELAELTEAINDSEKGMASGDSYSWAINMVRRFKAGHKVDVAQFGPSLAVGDVNLLANFPYKQATLWVAGTAHYHDFGRFLADLENQYPHVRVVNLDLRHNPSPAPGEKEKLAFKMDIVMLVKSNPS